MNPTRLLSLDVFRGMTVALMIMVNNPGDWEHLYAPLEHAQWHGCTPTDLVFPFFLFIVGVSITYSLSGAVPSRSVVSKIVVRSLKLFGLGLFLALFPKFNFETVRIMGVLQRIALVYLLASLLFLYLNPRQLCYTFGGILISYWALMALVPVPGIGMANLAPETNLGAWLDRLILGQAHLYKAAKVWDPEGLTSTLPAIATGISGILAGVLLKQKDVLIQDRLLWLFTAGLTLMALGWAWDSAGFPINKKIWTSSYVCWTSGLGSCFLAALYWLVDLKKYQFWTKPFVVYGVNAITVFFLSGLIPRILGMIKINQADGQSIGTQLYLYRNFIAPWFSSPYNASLAGAITCISIWLGVLWWMYHKKVFIKV
jgi:predicted acyltransferase